VLEGCEIIKKCSTASECVSNRVTIKVCDGQEQYIELVV